MPNRVGQGFLIMEKDPMELGIMPKEVKESDEGRVPVHTLTSVDDVGDSGDCLSPLEDRVSHHQE